MQESNATLPNIISMLEQTKTYLYTIRSDEGFNNTLEEAKIIAVEERFEQIKNHLTVFDFGLDNFFKINKANRSINCKSLENVLHDPF